MDYSVALWRAREGDAGSRAAIFQNDPASVPFLLSLQVHACRSIG